MTATPKFAHVVFQTGDLAAMRDWYRTVLDGHVVYENDHLCFLTYDEEHHRVALLSPPTPPARRTPATAGAHHVAYTFAHLDDLLARYELLRDQGVNPAVCVAHGVTTSLYYQDPDGGFVELQIDNFADPEAATGYLRGPEFAADPVGPAFDPAAMLTARRSGASVAELTARSWVPTGGLPDPMLVLTGAV